ncbi:hypothetical protein MBEHAL_0101 [Halarchaeum acidiphilum MH1-52-1]|uniref:Cell division protein A N-terminal domain-containing protein n=1 Tax=Halarchaeum acidiphilum MH1-52-1 TaxID=1261545 RepID=U2YCM8_9EURY|nr:MFS transporter [Halarchaeum acidiphilum]GAD51341.1 hypothetical protein MBEHAL_0101 [Halarchaeum acidiphilum MH1-52-1]
MESETTERVTDELVRVYRRYLGEPERLVDVYVGFGLFFAGVTLGVLGAVVFGWSSTVPASVLFHWQLREVAGTLALVGLPAFLLSIPVLLPVDRRAMYAAGLGAVVCLVGVGVFVASYPKHWNVQGTADYSTLGVLVYSVGLVVLVGAGGAGLVTDRVERARQAGSAAVGSGGGNGGSDGGTASAESEGTVTDEQVERDIEDAMSTSELSWGGVEKTKTTRLNLGTGGEEEEVERSNLTPENANVSRSESVDTAVSGLQKLRGNEEPEEATGEGADDQVAALQELRKKQQAEEVATADGEGVVDRMKSFLGR